MLKMLIRHRLVRKLNQALNRVGLRLTRYPPPADRRRARLIQRHAVTVVVDLGANTGQYGSMLRQHGYRGMILSYEPLPTAFRQLSAQSAGDANWQAFEAAVGAANGSVTLHVAGNLSALPCYP
jgi:hypothetical protein